jgi:hypothetical protein
VRARKEDRADFEKFAPGVGYGERIETRLNPLLARIPPAL